MVEIFSMLINNLTSIQYNIYKLKGVILRLIKTKMKFICLCLKRDKF